MNVGDLVHVVGLWPSLFKVEGYRIETIAYLKHLEIESVICELREVVTGERIEVLSDYVTMIAPSEKADEYIRDFYKTINYKSEVRKEMPKETKTEQIDRLLDELNDYKRLAAEFGDEEYKAKVEEIKRRLAEVSGG